MRLLTFLALSSVTDCSVLDDKPSSSPSVIADRVRPQKQRFRTSSQTTDDGTLHKAGTARCSVERPLSLFGFLAVQPLLAAGSPFCDQISLGL